MPRTISFVLLLTLPVFGFQKFTPSRELVTTYCVSCHNAKLKTAGLALDVADAEHVANQPELWEKVLVKLRSRSMPPVNVKRPTNAGYDHAADWIEAELDRAARANVNPGRTPSLHRLNRTEYANAVRDLFAVEVDAEAVLPPDEQAFGFDTNADALAMQPALLERYVAAAAHIARRAVGDPSIPAAFDRYGVIKGNSNEQTYLRQSERLDEEFPLGSRGGIAARHYFPVDGEYVIRLRMTRNYERVIRGLNAANQFDIRIDGKRIAQFTLGPIASPTTVQQFEGDEGLQTRVNVKAGSHSVVATLLKTDNTEPEGAGADRLSLYARGSDNANVAASLSSMLIGGPYQGKTPEDSPSRSLIFTCHPANAAEETACAAKILTRMARRAYRRAAANDDLETLLAFYRRGRVKGSFDDGIRAALERVLVSPDFLYRIEADPADGVSGKAYRVPDVELASRLSFALWSSVPDDALLDLAIKGQLSNAAILNQQVSRMLADPKARVSLVANFFGEWLQIRNVRLLNPESTKFPFFDDNLRLEFVKEIELFLDAQLREDRSILDLLTSNETFLNEDLAHHYGIRGVSGSHFRRVTLTDENRFGLLGKASVLAVTSYATRTAPTIRGKWLLENLLAAPPPAPPPNIPALEDSNKEGKPLAVREMLETHRKNPVCASCHARMDPLGLSLENFDAIGRWRAEDAGQKIDASGVLLDGTKVDGPAALARALVSQKRQFAIAVTEKLLTYALGRGLEASDAPHVRAIVRGAEASNYRWSVLISGIIRSAPFQMRRAGS